MLGATIKKTMEEYSLRHCISFCSSIARAKAFQQTQEKINEIS